MDDDDSTGVFSVASLTTPAAATSRRPFLVSLGGAADSFPLDRTKVIGRDPSADIRLEFEGISRKHVRIVVDGERITAQDLQSKNGMFVNGVRVENARLVEGDTLVIGNATLRLAYRDELDDASFQALRDSARRDALTGAYNRRYLDERLEAELAYARRHKTMISIVLADVDHFKRVNDTFGHLAGDVVLRGIAEQIQKVIRREDVLARYGGEELVVVSRDSAGEQTALLGERIRAAVESMRVTHDGKVIPVTISAGVTSGPGPTDATASVLLQRADEALYAAKRGGRNRVVVK